MRIEAYFADTNAFLYLLEKKPFMLPFIEQEWHFSVITEVELLGWHKINKKDIPAIENLLSSCMKHSLTENIIKQAIKLKQKQQVKTTDALIAATAIESSVPLLTADKAFTKIKELDIVLIEL